MMMSDVGIEMEARESRKGSRGGKREAGSARRKARGVDHGGKLEC